MRARRLAPAMASAAGDEASPDRPCGSQGRHAAALRALAFYVEQFDVEDQRRVWRDDAARAARPVAEFGRDDQGALAADLHGGDALVPAADHPALAQGKFEGLAAVDRAVELLALGAVLIEPAGIVHDGGLARLGCRAGADLAVRDLQA